MVKLSELISSTWHFDNFWLSKGPCFQIKGNVNLSLLDKNKETFQTYKNKYKMSH